MAVVKLNRADRRAVKFNRSPSGVASSALKAAGANPEIQSAKA